MLWLPRFNTETDYPWAVEYAKVLQNAFKDYHVQVINSADLQQFLIHSSSPLICFRRVVLIILFTIILLGIIRSFSL